MRRRRAVAATPVLAAILVSGCSPAAAPTPTPTATSTTYTCIDDGLRKAGTCSQADFQAQQKEQATFKEAQRLYQRVLDERNRWARQGGTDSPSPELALDTADPYLRQVVALLAAQKQQARRVEGELFGRDLRIERSRTRPDAEFVMRACEDGTRTHAFSATGADLGIGRIIEMTLYFRQGQADRWVLFAADGEDQGSCAS